MSAPPAPTSDPPAARSLVRIQVPGAQPLSGAQQRFNQWLQRIDRLAAQIQRLQAWSDHHLYGHVQALRESAQQAADLDKSIALLLHGRLADGGLTAAQQRTARARLRAILAGLDRSGDPQLQALWQQYRLDDGFVEEPLQPSPQDVLQWQRYQAQQERQAAKRAARKARKKPVAHQREQQQLVDADSALRTIFRQLASVLHPDREPEVGARQRKAALMSQVNAAYERKELATLLRLQLQVSEVDPDAIARMADERITALSGLLKEQAVALEADLARLELRLATNMGVAVAAAHDDEVLTQSLHRLQADQRQGVAELQAECALMQSDAGLKRWLKAQAALMRRSARDGLGN